ncbi:calmodulin-binding transcription activator 2-like isoform X2 [Arctopsyche grandis]|uniref:calmodulin-binding transcription activator 2-like isoform X2 n=1 Tax=Arctopsyche grandis TaxID=121162 RepID=UPI00406D845B
MQTHVSNTPLNANGEPIKLPDNLETLPKAENFPIQRHRWNTNEEIAAILISFDRHSEWQSKEVKIRPKSGSMLLYSRKKVRYRRDGYCWKKRKDGKTTREDHMKLKVQGTECIYGCYVHSAILPTFHRRCYWLLQNPDIVLVHYLNVPYPDDNKLAVITPSLALWGDKKEWTKEELVSQLKPMFFSEDEPDVNNELEISTAETVEAIVGQLMEKQRLARQAALVKQLECGCPEASCAGGKPCPHSMRRITSAKPLDQSTNPTASIASTSARQQSDNNNQVSSTTGTGSILLTTNSHPPRVYSRESRLVHHTHSSLVTHNSNGNIPTSNSTTNSPPLVLSLSQIQGGGGLLILNSSASNTTTNSVVQQSLVSPLSVTSFVCNTSDSRNNLSRPKETTQYKAGTLVLKQEIMETSLPSACRHNSESSYTSNSNTRTTTNVKFVNRISRSDDVTDNISTVLYETLTNGRKERSSPKSIQNHRMNMVCSAPATPSKYVDHNEERSEKKCHNIFSDTLVLFGTESGGSLISQSDGSSIVNGTFFNETLDLSHEDIQKTLSANMPLCSSDLDQLTSNNSIIQSNNVVINTNTVQVPGEELSPNDVIVSEINPMDFIENCDVVVSPTHVVDDDVFVNLDAFDMLGDFPELEALDPNTVSNHSLLQIEGKSSNHQFDSVSQKNESNSPPSGSHSDSHPTANITDYSPEWAYPEGGVKVLVTGPWHSTASSYTVLFDTYPVPTTLVQSGVLRCYCPAHEAGLATLQVACDGFVISNAVMFEYKLPPRDERILAPEPKVEPTSEGLLKFTLLHRLESMDDKLQIKQEPDGLDSVEDSALFMQPNFEDRLVTYCQARIGRSWKLLIEESNQEQYGSHRGMTLLHLAASLGYSRLVCTMLHWRAENSSMLLETEVDAMSQDDDGFTPLMWACSRGHSETALVLYRWNHTALNVRNKALQTALDCAVLHQHNNLVKEIKRLESKREITDCSGGPVYNNNLLIKIENGGSNFSASVSPATSISSLSSIASSSRLHDGVFLRPGAVTRSETQKFKTLQVNIPYSTSEGNKQLNDKDICIPMDVGGSPSPNRSLRNDTSPSQKLVKRSSVDSGINMTSVQSSDSLPSLRHRNRNNGKENPKLSRFDRSMSLPLSSFNPGDSSYLNNIDSGTRQLISRRMDYALCEVAGGPRSDSPLIDVEAMSDEESEHINKEQAAVVGEQDVRVFTLAEQIIAAMPDRIKNESEDMVVEGSPGIVDTGAPSDCLMEPLLDLPTTVNFETTEFNFEFSDHTYRYYDAGTPCSSLSPASSSCLPSPRSLPLADSPSPPPTTADFCEFLQASANLCERDFNNLTLSDREQRELYEAAKIIQKAYRSYKGRQKLEEQDKERAAAVCIQNYYRRYKQYAYFKQMTHAAMVIQHGYRSYCAHKRFKKGIQETNMGMNNVGNTGMYSRAVRDSGKGSPGSLKRTYSQRRQHQAARKIQQFMRQSKNKLQSERAARERQAVQLSAAVPQRSQYPGDNLQYMHPGNQIRSANNDRQAAPTSLTKSEEKLFLESLFGET